jgi:hypothetical protein
MSITPTPPAASVQHQITHANTDHAYAERGQIFSIKNVPGGDGVHGGAPIEGLKAKHRQSIFDGVCLSQPPKKLCWCL